MQQPTTAATSYIFSLVCVSDQDDNPENRSETMIGQRAESSIVCVSSYDENHHVLWVLLCLMTPQIFQSPAITFMLREIS